MSWIAVPRVRGGLATGLLLLLVVVSWMGFRTSAQTPAAAGRTIELVLDASGSMNGKLPDGRTKIDAARAAVRAFLDALPAGTRLAFRAYGHQSPREKHDCNDTALVVPFGNASTLKADVVAKANGMKAQGYTPITKVLEIAAKDFTAAEKTPRFIVLVSDGKETCDGDPCATARALQAAGVGIVIHTIGFDVDKAARTQLECVAKATGGTYFDAPNAELLAAVIAKAAVQSANTVVAEKAGQGFLTVKGAELHGHDVVDAATGKVVTHVGALKATVPLPSGIYNVKFGNAWWKSVEIKAARTTVLEPGVLTVKGATQRGHRILDAETGEQHGEVAASDTSATLMPGTYDVMFGTLVWPGVKVDAGKPVELRPAIVTVLGLSVNDVWILTADGRQAAAVSALASTVALPAGNYTIKVGTASKAFTAVEGETLTISFK